MKNIKYVILLIFAFTLCFCAKDYSSSIENVLDRADRFMFVNPDSSLAILDSLRPYSHDLDDKVKARYALLMTQAQSRNYILPENDSLINIAVDYYSKHKDRRRLAWSYLYASDVYDLLGNDSMAIATIKKAYSVADGQTDNRLHMYIHYFWGNLIEYSTPYEEGIKQLEQAKHYATLCGDTSKIIACINEIGTSYLYSSDIASAKKELQSALPLISDSAYARFGAVIHHKLSAINYYEGRYADALADIDKSIHYISNIDNYGDSLNIFSMKGTILEKMGEIDSSECYTIKGRTTSSFNATASYNLNMSHIEEARHNYIQALEYHKNYTAALDSMYNMMLEEKALEWQKKSDLLEMQIEVERLKVQKRNDMLMVAVLVMILLAIIFVLVMIIERRKRNSIRMEQMRVKQMNDTINKIQEASIQMLRNKDADIDNIREKVLSSNKTISKIRSIGSMDNSTKAKLMDQLYLTDNEMLDLEFMLDTCFNNFATCLTENYPKLSRNDVAICCLIKLGISHAGMAILLNISNNTLKMRKSRLRKEKLGITEPLDDWILGLE